MRVIAGTHRGSKLTAPPGLRTRPTSDRVRENVFNLVAPWVEDATVLDLFAGSGAMGIEALSRGASRVVFVESDTEACRAINGNLDRLKLTGAQVLCQDAKRFLAQETRKFDLILCDPPYDELEAFQPTLARLAPGLLVEGGLLVLETAARGPEPEIPLEIRTTRRYGAARITLFEA